MKLSLCGVLVVIAFFIGLLVGYGLGDPPARTTAPAATGAK